MTHRIDFCGFLIRYCLRPVKYEAFGRRRSADSFLTEKSEFWPAVNADENQLQQILYNVAGNAIKFTESGSVRVKARVVATGKRKQTAGSESR